jgi:CRP-like cAMP-binding protein
MPEALHKLLGEEKTKDLLAIARTKALQAGELFIEHGEVPAKIAFVNSGLFRYVYVNDKGNEFTKGIITENNFISSYSAMIANRPSYFAIEALEDAEVLEIHWTDFTKLLETDVFWLRFLLKFLEKGFISKEKRERDLLLLDAETRYKNFLNEFPGVDQRIKQGVIASYLGIKPETLSRIRRKIIF